MSFRAKREETTALTARPSSAIRRSAGVGDYAELVISPSSFHRRARPSLVVSAVALVRDESSRSRGCTVVGGRAAWADPGRPPPVRCLVTISTEELRARYDTLWRS